MNDELKHILDNPAASPEVRARARAALGVEIPETELPEAQRMLASLGKKHVRDITEEEWMSYFAKNHTPASEELIREWRYFVPPDDRTLWLLTGQDHIGGLRWWWQTTLEACGERADVKAHAKERLAAL